MSTTPPPVNTDVLRKVSRVFSPSAPVNDLSLFAGRQAQLAKIIEALSQRGQHVIIFRERGVGKTSLANVIPTAVRQADQPSFVVATVNCDGADTFHSIWDKVYREIHLEQAKTQIGFNRKTARYPIALSDLLPPPDSPEDVRYALTNIVNSPTLVVLDELDRLKEEAAPPTTFLLADTIKTLSDHSVPVTLILVGVADSVDKLIAGHQSIERALVQVLMPRMDREELEAIVKNGLKILALGIEPPVLDAMVGISRGFPYYVHALAYHAACYALTKDLKVVDFACLGVGISRSCGERPAIAFPRIRNGRWQWSIQQPISKSPNCLCFGPNRIVWILQHSGRSRGPQCYEWSAL